MVISQGDIFWARLARSTGSEPKNKRPMVIVQRDSINRSKFNTVLVVPLTKQTKHAHIPGNVLLHKGEANLPRSSLARCTHVMVLDKGRLIEKIGTLPKIRTVEIIDNIIWILGQTRKDLWNFHLPLFDIVSICPCHLASHNKTVKMRDQNPSNAEIPVLCIWIIEPKTMCSPQSHGVHGDANFSIARF